MQEAERAGAAQASISAFCSLFQGGLQPNFCTQTCVQHLIAPTPPLECGSVVHQEPLIRKIVSCSETFFKLFMDSLKASQASTHKTVSFTIPYLATEPAQSNDDLIGKIDGSDELSKHQGG